MKKQLLCSLLSTFIFMGTVFHSSDMQAQRTEKKATAEITKESLMEILNQNRSYYKQGQIATYIPELAKMNPQSTALSVVTEKGTVISVGDVHQKFTIQSISKLVALMIAVQEKGETEVFKNMGYFGTDKPFNHFGSLETSGKPLNPMMNSGAILTTSMIKGDGELPFLKILDMLRYITRNKDLDYSKAVYLSEKETGHRNRGMFYILKNSGLIEGSSEDQLDNYFKQCSIEVTAEDLAKVGYFFANGCVRFDGDAAYKSTDLSRLIQSQMLVAGMYEFSGEYARTAGLPSKSGVGGGITVSVPGKMGIGVFSPALDSHGNSLAGYHMILDLAARYHLNIFQ